MSSYFSFYDYCNKVLKIKFKEQKKWDCYLQTSNVQLIYPFKEFVVMSEKPIDIKMKNNILHNENGPSIKYADGFSVWSLNGIKVPQWLVETRAEEIDCNEFAKIENAEIRREFIRKVGIERMAMKLGAKTLDKEGEIYELLEIDLRGDTGKWPYLKMLNPSIGTWHLECVSKECKTVQQALNFRNGTDQRPLILT